jgi:hypothetical protein
MTIWTSLNGSQYLKAAQNFGPATIKRYDFEAIDDKGRRIGAMHTVQLVDVVDGGEECHALWEIERGYGSFLYVRVQMTKNGQAWGASQPAHWFVTDEEVQKFLAADLAKRVKKHGVIREHRT